MATLDYVELTGVDPAKIAAATKTIVGTVAYLYDGMGLTPNVPEGLCRPIRMPLELAFERTTFWPCVVDGGGEEILDVTVGLCCESSPDSLEFQKKTSAVLIDYLIGRGWDDFYYYYHQEEFNLYHQEEFNLFADYGISEEHCAIAQAHLDKVNDILEVLEGASTFNEAFLCLDRAITLFHQSQEQLREIGR